LHNAANDSMQRVAVHTLGVVSIIRLRGSRHVTKKPDALSGTVMVRALDSQLDGRGRPASNLRQVVHRHVPLSTVKGR